MADNVNSTRPATITGDEFVDDDAYRARPDTGAPGDHTDSPDMPGDVSQHLLEAAGRSAVPFRHLSALLAAAQLDENAAQDHRVGFLPFYLATCEHGQRHWMDPMPGLGEINETLRRYLAPRETLRPIVGLLTGLARAGVSPFAFLEYVVLPRLRDDRNWRRWTRAHLPVVRAVAGLIFALTQSAPYDKPRIGSAQHAVLTDVFLVKYIAGALAGRGVGDLSEAAVEEVQRAWGSLELTTHGFLLFLRYNVRPLLARIGNRLDIVRYLEVVDALRPIETAMAVHPSWRDGTRVHDALLWGTDAATEFDRRERRGYKAIHFLREFKALLSVYRTMLERIGGCVAVDTVVSRMRNAADSDTSVRIAELVASLADTGGRHTYVWHATRLVRLDGEKADAFVADIRMAGGAHPDYPRYRELFAYDAFRFAGGPLHRIAVALNLAGSDSDTAKAEKRPVYRSPRDVLQAFVDRHPEVLPVVQQFKSDAANGRDVHWTQEDLLRFDTLDGWTDDPVQVSALHGLLLYATIRGISGQYTRGVRSGSVSNLWKSFRLDPNPRALRYDAEFTRAALSTRSDHEKRAREKTNVSAVSGVWQRIATADRASTPLDAIGGRYRNLSRDLAWAQGERGIDHPATRRLSEQVDTLSYVQDQWESWSDEGRLCAVLLLAGYFGRKAEALRAAALQAALGWAVDDSGDRERLASDQEVTAWVESTGETEGGDTLASLALTRRKEVTPEAIDAAFRSIVNLSVLAKELAKWREHGADSDHSGGDGPRYRLFTSRTPLDSYYGDMGATCLSSSPVHVSDPGFVNIRLSDLKRNEIVGQAAMQYVNGTVQSVSVRGYWFAFAFNPVRAVTNGLGRTEQISLYRQFWNVVEHIAGTTGKPVFLPGVTSYGVVSNDTAFGNLIIEYEKKRGGRFVGDARGFALQYPEEAYAQALMLRV